MMISAFTPNKVISRDTKLLMTILARKCFDVLLFFNIFLIRVDWPPPILSLAFAMPAPYHYYIIFILMEITRIELTFLLASIYYI